MKHKNNNLPITSNVVWLDRKIAKCTEFLPILVRLYYFDRRNMISFGFMNGRVIFRKTVAHYWCMWLIEIRKGRYGSANKKVKEGARFGPQGVEIRTFSANKQNLPKNILFIGHNLTLFLIFEREGVVMDSTSNHFLPAPDRNTSFTVGLALAYWEITRKWYYFSMWY